MSSRSRRRGDKAARWQDQVYDLLRRHKVTQFAYVPDAGHRILIDRSLADPDVHSVALTTEEEGVALLAGADLGGARGVLLMQSSGVGNCINMLSLTQRRALPVPGADQHARRLRRGQPVAVPHGQGDPARARGHGRDLPARRDPEEALATVDAAITMVFQAGRAVAVLFTQKLLGAKKF